MTQENPEPGQPLILLDLRNLPAVPYVSGTDAVPGIMELRVDAIIYLGNFSFHIVYNSRSLKSKCYLWVLFMLD